MPRCRRAVLAASAIDDNLPARSAFHSVNTRSRQWSAVANRLGNDVYGTNSYHLDDEVHPLGPGEVFDAEFRLPTNLGPDRYTVTAALHAGRVHLEGSYDWWDHAVAFEVVPGPEPYFVGRAYLPATLRFEKRSAKTHPGSPEAPR